MIIKLQNNILKKAIETDNTFIYAYHNYACVLSLTWDGTDNVLIEYEVFEGMRENVAAKTPAFTGRYTVQGEKLVVYLPDAAETGKDGRGSGVFNYKPGSDFFYGTYKNNKFDISFLWQTDILSVKIRN